MRSINPFVTPMSILKCIAVSVVLLASSLVSADVASAPTTRAELAARRARAVEWLHDYRDKGVFPTDEVGMPWSVFMDKHGVLCPMAQMIRNSGHDDLVTAVYLKANDLRLADIDQGPLYDWMLHSGLTIGEIAMVQGAMTFTEREMLRAGGDPVLAHEQVLHKLDRAEAVLRANTRTSLNEASIALRQPYVATGDVVPKAVLAAAMERRYGFKAKIARSPRPAGARIPTISARN